MLLSPQLKCAAGASAAVTRQTPSQLRAGFAPPSAPAACSTPALSTAALASSSNSLPEGVSSSCLHRRQRSAPHRAAVVVRAASKDDQADDSGDSAAAELKETAAMDELIDVLLKAKTQQELARLVAENVVAIDIKFWLRVATRSDTATSKEEQERLQVMASAVMLIVDTVKKRTEQQLSDSSRTLQAIMTAAADEKGEWYLPLKREEVDAVRAALDRHSEQLDEALLSNAFAWIRKCTEDRFDTMVQLIQKVLQLYAAKQLQTPEKEGVEGAVNQVVYAEEHEWAPLVEKFAREGVISEPAFMGGLQKRMESTVLGLQSGSYAQRIQAEYLKEVEQRAKSVFRELAKANS